MSHIERLRLHITDLAALEAAVPALGLRLVRDAETFRYYYGTEPCEHKLVLENGRPQSYEIGIRTREDGQGFDLVCDMFDRQIAEAVGGSLECGRLKQAYGATVASRHYQELGYETFQTVDRAGNVIIQAIKN